MVVVMMVAGMDDHDNLRLRRIGYCEAEGEHESEQNLFHKPSMLTAESEYRATLTAASRPCTSLHRQINAANDSLPLEPHLPERLGFNTARPRE